METETKTVDLRDPGNQEALDELAKEGWIVVSVDRGDYRRLRVTLTREQSQA